MQHTKPQRVYYHKLRIPYLSLSFLLLFFGLWLSINLRFISVAFSLFLVSIFIIYTYQTVRIVTSPVGISYHNMGVYTINSSWDNIESISVVDFKLIGKQRCILLKEGVKLKQLSGLAWAISKEQRGRTIPLTEGFGFKKQDELVQDVKHYAPHAIIEAE